MKNLKVKSILFSLLAMMTVAVFLTSCEQGEVITDEIDNLSSIYETDSFIEFDDLMELPEGLPEDVKNAIESELNNSNQDVESRACCTIPSFYFSNGKIWTVYRVNPNRSFYVRYRCNGTYLSTETDQFHNYSNNCKYVCRWITPPSCGDIEAQALMGEWDGNCAETKWIRC